MSFANPNDLTQSTPVSEGVEMAGATREARRCGLKTTEHSIGRRLHSYSAAWAARVSTTEMFDKR